MMLSKIGLAIGILLLSFGLYSTITFDQATPDELLNQAVAMLAEEFVGLLPENANRASFRSEFQKISKRVHTGDLQPEQVERIAIGILNASNLEQQITTEEADQIFKFVLQPAQAIVVNARRASAVGRNNRRMADLAERIRVACEFNKKLKSCGEKSPEQREILRKNIRYERKNGIQVQVDLQFRDQFSDEHFSALEAEFQTAERRRLVSWQDNYADRLAHQTEELRCRIDSLQSLFNFEAGGQHHATTQSREQLQTLKTIGKLCKWNAVDEEHARELVRRELK